MTALFIYLRWKTKFLKENSAKWNCKEASQTLVPINIFTLFFKKSKFRLAPPLPWTSFSGLYLKTNATLCIFKHPTLKIRWSLFGKLSPPSQFFLTPITKNALLWEEITNFHLKKNHFTLTFHLTCKTLKSFYAHSKTLLKTLSPKSKKDALFNLFNFIGNKILTLRPALNKIHLKYKKLHLYSDLEILDHLIKF